MLHLILVVAIMGFLAWLVMQIPMPPLFKNVLYGVMALFLIIYVLQSLGFNTGFGNLRMR